DISDGGLGVALAEMAMAGNIGADITLDIPLPPHAALFAEDQGCYVFTVKPEDVEMARGFALAEDIPLHIIGTIGHTDLKIDGALTISVSRLKDVHTRWLPELMSRPGSE
ncbi:MAG: AIR synthase-related protein, partial [Sneathiella sp.]